MKRTSLVAMAMLAACTKTAPPPETPVDGEASRSPSTTNATCCPADESQLREQMKLYEAVPASQRPPELAILPYRLSSGLNARDRKVITDQNTWRSIWPQIIGTQRPVPPLPAVDFSRDQIVVASMGQRNSGGYTITVDTAYLEGDHVVIALTEHSPGGTCGTTAALTAPIALARVPHARVVFRENVAVTNCG